MRFVPFVFLAFVAGEIATFIMVGQRIGVLATLGLLFLSFVAGIGLIRSTGLAMGEVLGRRPANAEEAAKQATAATFRMLAGLLLITPGFLTDAAAGLLLIPAVQAFLRKKVSGPFVNMRGEWPVGARRPGPIIEGEAVEIEGEITHSQEGPKT